jgi:hypothetical protein
MRIGPGPPSRRKNRTGTNASRGIMSAGTAGTDSTAGSSLSDLGPVQSVSSVHLSGHSWNSRRYQRADEEFAYFPPLEENPKVQRQMNATGSSVGMSGWSAQPVEKPESIYYHHPARAPPVNDLHPPVVSTVPAKKNERAWMMEPPPSASFMNGKKGVTTRSRSGSGNSSLKNTDPGLGRQVGHKMVEEKVKRGETPLPESDKTSLHRKSTATSATGRSSPMKSRPSSSLENDVTRTPSRRRTRPAQIHIPTFDSSNVVNDSSPDSTDILRPTNKGNRPRSTADGAKPHLPAAGRPGLTAKSRSSENSTTLKAVADKSPNRASSATLSPLDLSTPSTTPSPRRNSSRRTESSLRIETGSIVDEYTPSPRKPKRGRKDTKIDVSSDSDDEVLHDPDQQRRGRSRHSHSLLVKDSSLAVLQDQVELRGLKGNTWIRSPVVEARVPLPGDGIERDGLVLGERKRWSFDL